MKAAKNSRLKPSKYLVCIPLPGKAAGYLLYSTRTQKSFILPLPLEAGNPSFVDLPEAAKKKLEFAKILVPTCVDETAEIMEENRIATTQSDTLYHVIQPSAYCQMACGYCGQEHTKASLSESSVDIILSLIERQLKEKPSYKNLAISWFGAEPLTSFKKVISISERLLDVCERHSVNLSAKMVTNGVNLSREIASILRDKAKIDFAEITLDGFGKYHDIARPLKNGRSSFERIVSNIESIVTSDVDMNIRVRCNVSRENTDSVFELAKNLHDREILSEISIYLAPLHSWGNDAHEMGLGFEEFAQLEIEFFEYLGALLNVSKPKLLPDRKYNTCLNTKPDSYVFDAFGNAFDCTEVSYVPVYLESEELHKDVTGLEAPQRSFSDYHSGVADGTYPCGDCRILPICGGSCPKLWTEGHIPCPSLKTNIEQRLLMSFAQ